MKGEVNETFSVDVSSLTGAVITDGQGLGTITNDDDMPTYAIQGSGLATTLSGTYTTNGVVVADFEGGLSPEIRGFYIQDPTGDADPATSDGLFVYNGSNDNVALGDLVSVTGTVSDYQDQTQISASSIVVLSTGNTISPTDIILPFASVAVEEQYEGMLVRVPQTLTVTEMYLLGRFGQVTMGGTGKLYQPTSIVDPGAPAIAMLAANNLNKIIVDDALNNQNPDPIVFGRGGLPLSASNTLRGGDTLTGLVGVFTYAWGGNSASPNAYRIRPINSMGGGIPNFVAANPRPAAPPVVTGSIKVVGMNMLNYFNSFTSCFPSGTVTDCRGADDDAEFTRQSDKIVNAILALNADVIGIMEIENDGYGPTSAIQDLVNKLNLIAGAGTYAFIDADALTGKTNALGLDAIKVGILYQPAAVTPVGQTAVLDTVAFVNGGDLEPRNRVSLLQAFQTVSGEQFLVNVNHLKSKGSACTIPDAGDGQGNCNVVRTNAVNELISWYATDPTGINDPDLLIVGDMNSYAKEDPIKAFEAAGFTNMVNYWGSAESYSYVFDGQWGYLDYALGSSSLLAQSQGTTEWHINSDEPIVLDYNTDFKTAGQIIDLYSPEPFRASDHDPVLVGLELSGPDTQIDTHPAAVTSSTLAEFTFSSPDLTATFECSLDLADFTACTSGTTSYSGLLAGDHNFRVRAVNTNLNVDVTPASFSWTIDLVGPTVLSIVRADSNPVNAASVDFVVTFSEPVSGPGVNDFTLTASSGLSGAAVIGVTGSGATLTVTVDTGSGNGTLLLNVVDNNTILDEALNPLGGAAIGDGDFTAGDAYTVFKSLPPLADFNGDGKADVAVFRPSTGIWYISGQGIYSFGQSGDLPVSADYNGDGKADIAVFRPSNSTWYIKGVGSFLYGQSGDIPVPADYNGDGKTDIAVFRPSNSTWYIKGVGSFLYGQSSDIPVVADYNGDGKADIAVFRPSNSTWYIKGMGSSVYGMAGDIPAVADYNGDGKADIAVFRPSNNTWYIKGMGTSLYGMAGDIPVIGDYNGDGKADIAVFRPSNSTWYIRGIGPSVYGMEGDIPV
jgi:predicted extracellular nuclease